MRVSRADPVLKLYDVTANAYSGGGVAVGSAGVGISVGGGGAAGTGVSVGGDGVSVAAASGVFVGGASGVGVSAGGTGDNVGVKVGSRVGVQSGVNVNVGRGVFVGCSVGVGARTSNVPTEQLMLPINTATSSNHGGNDLRFFIRPPSLQLEDDEVPPPLAGISAVAERHHRRHLSAPTIHHVDVPGTLYEGTRFKLYVRYLGVSTLTGMGAPVEA